VIATAPGKLILTGEYAVLDGAPALVIAVNRRARAHRHAKPPTGSSPFLVAVAEELAARFGDDHAAARAALEISVDSSAFYDGMTKLGLGSSAAVTVAATACSLAETGEALDKAAVLAIALAAHARAQAPRGSRGSGADVAAAVHGGLIVFTSGRVEPKEWPRSVTLLPFFTGHSADTLHLVSRVAAARSASPIEVDAALAAIADASRAAHLALAAPLDLAARALIAALSLAGHATDRLAIATGLDLVPECVSAARSAMARLGGTAKTTGAGGGDVAIAAIPTTADAIEATRSLIEVGCKPLDISLDETGVDTRPGAQ
jgi:phosphomevalonate kinase